MDAFRYREVAYRRMDHHSRDVAVFVAKMAYRVTSQGDVRYVFAPVRRLDERDEAGGLGFPADLAADEKPGTDVGLVGTAAPPSRATHAAFYGRLETSGKSYTAPNLRRLHAPPFRQERAPVLRRHIARTPG